MGCLPPQNLFERAGLLTGPNHVDDQIREDVVLASHGIGETPTLGHILLELTTGLTGNPLGGQAFHAAQGHRERHSRTKQIGQLERVHGQLLESGLFGAPCEQPA